MVFSGQQAWFFSFPMWAEGYWLFCLLCSPDWKGNTHTHTYPNKQHSYISILFSNVLYFHPPNPLPLTSYLLTYYLQTSHLLPSHLLLSYPLPTKYLLFIYLTFILIIILTP